MWLPVAKCLHTALEAHNSNLNIYLFGRLAHQPPDTVVCNEVTMKNKDNTSQLMGKAGMTIREEGRG
jgi:hypothetical protein